VILEWIWFCAFVAVALWTARQGFRRSEEGDAFGAGGVYLMVALMCAAASIDVTWSALGGPLLVRLDQWLPEKGTAIHTISALVIFALLVVAYLAALFAGPTLVAEAALRRGRLHPASRAQPASNQ
jgi:hypothetical protein